MQFLIIYMFSWCNNVLDAPENVFDVTIPVADPGGAPPIGPDSFVFTYKFFET